MKTNQLIYYIAVVLCVVFMTGCHSSRSTTKTSGSKATVYKLDSQKVVTGSSRESNDLDAARRLVDGAKSWLGTPYAYGGTSRKGADCSGFVMCLFREELKVELPRDSRSQHSYCKKIKTDRMQPGDLVFFTGKPGGGNINHVGLYVGDNCMVHASTSKGVVVTSLDDIYWTQRIYSAGRVEAITYAALEKKAAGNKKEDKKKKGSSSADTGSQVRDVLVVDAKASPIAKAENKDAKKKNSKKKVESKKKKSSLHRATAAPASIPVPASPTIPVAAPDTVMSSWMD